MIKNKNKSENITSILVILQVLKFDNSKYKRRAIFKYRIDFNYFISDNYVHLI